MRFFCSIFLSVLVLASHAQKREIDVSSFSELSFGISGELYLTQGSREFVEIEADDDDFDKIEFYNRGGRLSIRSKERNGWRSGRMGRVRIYVTAKELDRISVSGSGSIYGEGKFDADDLKIVVSGSGSISLESESRDLEVRVSGSGSMELTGSSEYAEIGISGSGRVKARDMTVETLDASISGSGSCYITVEKEIEANISGSGSVYYDGDPDRVINNASGSGKVRRI